MPGGGRCGASSHWLMRRVSFRGRPVTTGLPLTRPKFSLSAIAGRSASSTAPGRSSSLIGEQSGRPSPLSPAWPRASIVLDPRGRRRRGPMTMRTSFSVNDMTIHRIVEQEAGFTPILEFLPSLSPGLLDENRSWMVPAALDASGMAVLCFQSYVVKTPHHTILVDACIGNDKSFPHRPTWHRKSDSTWMQALEAAGVTVDDIDIVMCTHLHGDHVGWNTRRENGRWVPTFANAKYLFSKKEFEYW